MIRDLSNRHLIKKTKCRREVRLLIHVPEFLKLFPNELQISRGYGFSHRKDAQRMLNPSPIDSFPCPFVKIIENNPDTVEEDSDERHLFPTVCDQP